MKLTYACIVCGTVVTRTRTPANLNGKAPRYCSQRCHGDDIAGRGRGPTPNHEYDCESCGRHCHVYRPPSAVAPRFCSTACTGMAQRGEANPAFVSGRHVDAQGYVRVRLHGRYQLEHRVVMEGLIGRPLTAVEVVHHRNHDKQDNRPENLVLCATQAEHVALHANERKCA